MKPLVFVILLLGSASILTAQKRVAETEVEKEGAKNYNEAIEALKQVYKPWDRLDEESEVSQENDKKRIVKHQSCQPEPFLKFIINLWPPFGISIFKSGVPE